MRSRGVANPVLIADWPLLSGRMNDDQGRTTVGSLIHRCQLASLKARQLGFGTSACDEHVIYVRFVPPAWS